VDEREIVGRDDELAAVTAFLSAAEPASALLLEGEAGIGKTTIWSAGVEEARTRGYRTLVARPVGSETPLAFAALIDLLGEAFDQVEGELPPPQRRALAVALLRAEAADSPPEPGAIAVAVREALRRLAARGPLLVAVDDVQWLDAASASALAFAAPRQVLARRRRGTRDLRRRSPEVTADRVRLDRAGGWCRGNGDRGREQSLA
jgi:predicted ATPase